MEIVTIAVTLFLIMDPLGNIPFFLSVLKHVPEKRRTKVLLRELVIALGIMLLFLFLGPSILKVLSLTQEAVAIGGGLVLMIIAIKMIFPSKGGIIGDEEIESEPLIVPLAVPMIAGPSVLATLILFVERNPGHLMQFLQGLLLAWVVSAIILLNSPKLYKVLGNRGLKAVERLMGMILISISVQMLLDGFQAFFKHG